MFTFTVKLLSSGHFLNKKSFLAKETLIFKIFQNPSWASKMMAWVVGMFVKNLVETNWV